MAKSFRNIKPENQPKVNFKLNTFIDVKNVAASVIKMSIAGQIGTKKADMILKGLNVATNCLKLHYEKEKIVELNEQLSQLLKSASIDVSNNAIIEKETKKHNEKLIEAYNLEEEPEVENEEADYDETDIEIIENMDLYE